MSHHHHGHGAGEHHVHAAEGSPSRRLAVVLALTAAYMVAEAVGGWRAHSLALLADAGHMLSDVAALALSLFAAWIAQRPATPARSYGYHRTEIIAALANASTLIAISVWICIEAYHRIGAPPVVAGGLVMAIAAGGFTVKAAAMGGVGGGSRASHPKLPARWRDAA